jgi:hypothetical protein
MPSREAARPAKLRQRTDRAGAVPVRNLVCKVYRDDEIRVRFFYDELGRLSRTSVDMQPFYSLPLPGGVAIHWAR